MDEKTYRQLPERDMVGKTVKTKVELANGWCRLPAGTLMIITGKYGGLELQSKPCETCGVRVRFTRVKPSDVELL